MCLDDWCFGCRFEKRDSICFLPPKHLLWGWRARILSTNEQLRQSVIDLLANFFVIIELAWLKSGFLFCAQILSGRVLYIFLILNEFFKILFSFYSFCLEHSVTKMALAIWDNWNKNLFTFKNRGREINIYFLQVCGCKLGLKCTMPFYIGRCVNLNPTS